VINSSELNPATRSICNIYCGFSSSSSWNLHQLQQQLIQTRKWTPFNRVAWWKQGVKSLGKRLCFSLCFKSDGPKSFCRQFHAALPAWIKPWKRVAWSDGRLWTAPRWIVGDCFESTSCSRFADTLVLLCSKNWPSVVAMSSQCTETQTTMVSILVSSMDDRD